MDTTEKHKGLARFGFRFDRGGAHTARSMMLNELGGLLSCIDNPEAGKTAYRKAIVDENRLGKRSGKTRILTYRHLARLYSLDLAEALFRALLFLWRRDPNGQPLLALLCAYARDSILRLSAPFILAIPAGLPATRESMEAFIESKMPGRFSQATLKSTAQNINATWTKSGHLSGYIRKTRAKPIPTAGSLAYALLISYLAGQRGQGLFQAEYSRLLDCSFDEAVALAEEASRRGWIIFKRVGDTMEASFPRLVNQEELEWLREQN